jgi:hypothetical protein
MTPDPHASSAKTIAKTTNSNHCRESLTNKRG